LARDRLMPESTPTLTIRSFRLAFELERRIHRIDRFRLPLPYGLPLRGAAYALAAAVVVVIASRLPLAGSMLGALPWPIRFGVLPVAMAQLLMQVKLDGRPAHEALAAWLRLRLGPRRVVAFESRRVGGMTVLDDLAVVPDEREPRYRRGAVSGEGAVVLRQDAEVASSGSTLTVIATEERPRYRGRRIALKPGQKVVLR
jgi:hypothetical protein